MLCKPVSRSGSGITASNQFAWYPWGRGYENQEDLERRNIRQWLNDNLPPQEACGWIGYLRNNWRPRTSDFLSLVSTCHTIELVQLLYPRFPHLFLASHMYSLSPMLFTDLCQPPFTSEVLRNCALSRMARFNAACLFALTGSVACLEALLEQGADPDGMDGPESWSYIQLLNGLILPVTPMDCALLSGNEDCQQVLEMYGGASLHENLPL